MILRISLSTMSRHPTIKLPPLNLTVNTTPMRGRGRSGSLVKVEHVGDRTLEETLDQSSYSNINANWVNAKGTHSHGRMLFFSETDWAFCRGMAYPRCPDMPGQTSGRRHPRNDSTNQLDACYFALSCSASCHPRTFESASDLPPYSFHISCFIGSPGYLSKTTSTEALTMI